MLPYYYYLTLIAAVVSISQQAEQDNCIKGGIIFTYLIDNVTVPENGETFIPCEFNYTKSSLYVNQPLPFWRIQPGDSNKPSSQVFIGYLPQDHQYNGSGLKIYNVDRSMNQTKYACCFDIFALRDICEAKSTIIIIKGIQPGKSTSTLQTWRLDLSILLLIALVTVL